MEVEEKSMKVMDFRLMLGIMATIVVLGGGYYLYTNSDQYLAKYGKTEYVNGTKVEQVGQQAVLDRRTEGSVAPVGGGWSQYMSDELGLAFRFPSHWGITEQAYNTLATSREGQASVLIEGDGYSVYFSNKGIEYPGGVDTRESTRLISGQKARVLEDIVGDGYMMSVFDACGITISVSSSAGSKEITDKILTSVSCPMSSNTTASAVSATHPSADAIYCIDELYRSNRSQYEYWESKFTSTHPSLMVYDAGSYCQMSDGTQLVSFSFFKPYTGEWKGITADNAGQSVALFDAEGNLLAETEGLFERTLGDLGYPLITSVKNGIATFVLGGGDAGYSASATYELELENFIFKKVSSTSGNVE